MSCSGLANVLSGVAAIWRPRQGRPSADHTAIGASHHRISVGMITVASANDRHPQIPWLIPRRAAVGASRPLPCVPAKVPSPGVQPVRREQVFMPLSRSLLSGDSDGKNYPIPVIGKRQAGAPLPNSSGRRVSQEIRHPPAHAAGDRPACLKLHLRGLVALVAGCCRALRTRFRVRKGAPRY